MGFEASYIVGEGKRGFECGELLTPLCSVQFVEPGHVVGPEVQQYDM